MSHVSNANESADCPVCLDMFGTSGPTTPHVLFCGHCVCYGCADQLAQSVPKGMGGFRCPECGFLEPRRLATIPKNFALIRLLEAMAGDTSNLLIGAADTMLLPRSPGVSPPRSPPALPTLDLSDSERKRQFEPSLFAMAMAAFVTAQWRTAHPSTRPVYEPGDVIPLPSVTGEHDVAYERDEASMPAAAAAAAPADESSLIAGCEHEDHLACTLIMSHRPAGFLVSRYPPPKPLPMVVSAPDQREAHESDRCTVHIFGNMPPASGRIGRRAVRPCASVDPTRPGAHLWVRYPCGRYGMCSLTLRTEYITHSPSCGARDAYEQVEVMGFDNPPPLCEPALGENINCFAVLPTSSRCLLFNIATRQLLVWSSLNGTHCAVAGPEAFESREFGYVFISAIHANRTSASVLISRPTGVSEDSEPLAWIRIPNHLLMSWTRGLTGHRWNDLSQTIQMAVMNNPIANASVQATAWSDHRSTGPIVALAERLAVPEPDSRACRWRQSYMINNRLDVAMTKDYCCIGELPSSLAVHQPSGRIVTMGSTQPAVAEPNDTTERWLRIFTLLTPGQEPLPENTPSVYFDTTNRLVAFSHADFCVDPGGHIWIVHGDSNIISVIAAPLGPKGMASSSPWPR